jgi:hypothetical protein
MKIVLRHKTTGRYYQSPGKWVRRADNALTFDAVGSARIYLRTHRLGQTQAVLRLAPYLIPLLHGPRAAGWDRWRQARASQWYPERTNRFGRN